jgi:hypothetical protein
LNDERQLGGDLFSGINDIILMLAIRTVPITLWKCLDIDTLEVEPELALIANYIMIILSLFNVTLCTAAVLAL